MFEVGFTEILLIFGIALLVLGPERLPKLAADLGRWAGRARAMARQLRTQLEQEVQFDPLATNPPRPHASPVASPPAPASPPPAAAAAASEVADAAPGAADVTPAPATSDGPAGPDTTVPDERQPG